MLYESLHWVPTHTRRPVKCNWLSDGPPPAAPAHPAAPTPTPEPGHPAAPTPTVEGFAPGFILPVPQPLREPTVVIWSSEHCSACRNSAPTFRALENNASGWKVVHVEATPEIMRQFPGHILSLPTYDFLYPDAAMQPHTNALGLAGVRVRTVRINSPEVLREIVPSLRL